MAESEAKGGRRSGATASDGLAAVGIMPLQRTLLQRIVRARLYYLLLTPTIILLLIFNYYPAFLALQDSLFNVDYGRAGVFIGLENFINLFHDSEFLQTIPRVAQLTVFGAITAVTVPVIVAEWIFRLQNKRAQYFYRILMIWPAIVPGVVTILVWQFIYDPYSGILNALLKTIGLGGWAQNWLGDPNIALYSVMGSAFPFVGGIAVLIYLAGLQSISGDIFDSAAIDGAHGLRRFFGIDLPLIIGQIKLNLVLAIIASVQNFAGILILTNGGPANSTEVPGLYMYNNAFLFDKIGYASAIGVLVFLCILVLTFLNIRYLRERT